MVLFSGANLELDTSNCTDAFPDFHNLKHVFQKANYLFWDIPSGFEQ